MKFNLEIQKTISFGKLTVHLFDPVKKVEHFHAEIVITSKRNVCCLDENGKVLWIIQDFAKDVADADRLWLARCYTNIWEENRLLKSFNFCGFFCTVDPLTGAILETEEE